MMYGVDISRYQKGVDISKVKAEGFNFAILKIGGSDSGRYKDSQFETFYSKCKELKMPVGCYYFGKDLSEEEAEKSANHFVELMKNHQFEMPVYYDVEGAMINVGKTKLTAIIKKFCSIVEKAGYYVGIYSSLSFFNSSMNDNELKNYTHWVACWSKSQNKPTLKSGADCMMLQYGGETNFWRSNKVAGMTMDQDVCYVDFESVIKKLGLNGFQKQQEIKEHNGYYLLVKTVWEGVGSYDINFGIYDDYEIAKQIAREVYKEENAKLSRTDVCIKESKKNQLDDDFGTVFSIQLNKEREY